MIVASKISLVERLVGSAPEKAEEPDPQVDIHHRHRVFDDHRVEQPDLVPTGREGYMPAVVAREPSRAGLVDTDLVRPEEGWGARQSEMSRRSREALYDAKDVAGCPGDDKRRLAILPRTGTLSLVSFCDPPRPLSFMGRVLVQNIFLIEPISVDCFLSVPIISWDRT